MNFAPNPGACVKDLVPLNLLTAGQTGEVCQLVGKAEEVHRLEEIGLRCGTDVTMVQAGSPCIIRFGNQTFCFRADEILRVLVRPRVLA